MKKRSENFLEPELKPHEKKTKRASFFGIKTVYKQSEVLQKFDA